MYYAFSAFFCPLWKMELPTNYFVVFIIAFVRFFRPWIQSQLFKRQNAVEYTTRI